MAMKSWEPGICPEDSNPPPPHDHHLAKYLSISQPHCFGSRSVPEPQCIPARWPLRNQVGNSQRVIPEALEFCTSTLGGPRRWGGEDKKRRSTLLCREQFLFNLCYRTHNFVLKTCLKWSMLQKYLLRKMLLSKPAIRLMGKLRPGVVACFARSLHSLWKKGSWSLGPSFSGHCAVQSCHQDFDAGSEASGIHGPCQLKVIAKLIVLWQPKSFLSFPCSPSVLEGKVKTCIRNHRNVQNLGVPVVAPQKWIWLWTMRLQVRSLA